MDFKDKIRAKYTAQVSPSFEDKNWDSFLAHKRKKEKKPMLFFLYLAGLAGIAIVGTLLITKAPGKVSTNVDSTNNLASILAQDNNSNQTESTMALPDLIEDAEKNISRENIQIKTEESNNTKDGAHVSAKNTDFGRASKSTSRLAKSMPDTDIKLNPSNHHSVHESSDLSSTNNDKFIPSVSNKKPVPSPTSRTGLLLIEKLPTKKVDLSYTNLLDASYSPIDITSKRKPLWQRHGSNILVYGGISFPLNVETVEEQAHQFGARLYYNLGKRIRAKSGFEFALISFRSNSINPALGVEYVESPSDIVTFNNAIVESLNLSWDLGFDALVFSRKNLKGHLGISYLTAVELDKEIEYNFNGDDDNDSNDDIHVAVKDIKKYFVPHILKFEMGIQYETRIGGLNLSVGYPYQLSKNKLELLSQIQLNLGFTRIL
jgi:hypothetical protein